MIAITHIPSPRMESCELTYLTRTPIDHARADEQYQAYCQSLRECGAEVHTLEVNRTFPDCVFVEDTAIVLDEIAVIASMGAESRRKETPGIERELKKYREIRRIEWPATLEGGDVLQVDRQLLVGLSSRTNEAGIKALEKIAADFQYTVRRVRVPQCLHLKTACTALPGGVLLINPRWLDVDALAGFDLLPIPESEPWSANVAIVRGTVCLAAAHPRTADLIGRRGFNVRAIDLSEFAKAEGGVTCLSLLFSSRPSERSAGYLATARSTG